MVAPAVVGTAGGLGLCPGVVVDELGEAALDLAGRTVPPGCLGGEHDLERVVGVLGPRERGPAALDAVDEVPEPLRPRPAGVALRMDAPGALLVPPQLPALGRPVVAEQLDRPLFAVDLDRRRAVALHREAGRHDGEARAAEV